MGSGCGAFGETPLLVCGPRVGGEVIGVMSDGCSEGLHVVDAGGLLSAVYLKKQNPKLQIRVLEALPRVGKKLAVFTYDYYSRKIHTNQ